MKIFALLTVALFVPAMAVGQTPVFFMDFDDDGVADYDAFVETMDIPFLTQMPLYIGVCWEFHCQPENDIGMAAAEYAVVYTGALPPSAAAYAEPGAPGWALTIGNLLDGGWFQSGLCRDACSGEFIAVITLTGVGQAQNVDFARTAAPYEFPGLFQVYDCVPVAYEACARNNAAAVPGVPNPIAGDICYADCPSASAAAPSTWGSVKAMFN